MGGVVFSASPAKKKGQVFIAKGDAPWYSNYWGVDKSHIVSIDITDITGSVRQATVTCDIVTNISMMFYRCSSLTSIDLSNFNTSNVINMYCMFFNCSSLNSLDLSNFNTSNVTDMYSMFYGCSKLTTIKGVIDMKSCKYWDNMFLDCPKLSGVKIKNPPSNFEVFSSLSKSQYTIVS